MGFDGSWCNVSSLCHYPIFTPLLIQVNSTASCCIVRTVLNNESIPIDKTCGFPCPNWRSIADVWFRWRWYQLVLENVMFHFRHKRRSGALILLLDSKSKSGSLLPAHQQSAQATYGFIQRLRALSDHRKGLQSSRMRFASNNSRVSQLCTKIKVIRGELVGTTFLMMRNGELRCRHTTRSAKRQMWI